MRKLTLILMLLFAMSVQGCALIGLAASAAAAYGISQALK